MLVYGLWYSTSLISYEWRWNRVPQYFAYQAEEGQRVADYGTVSAIADDGDM
ncbi:amino acid ABC transporter permease, partial [Pseudomonas sp. BN417]|nr:amino acid ABC transporter permease [Pseudomonas sp. BN417]